MAQMPGILANCRIGISGKVKVDYHELINMIIEAGAEYDYSNTPMCTHIIMDPDFIQSTKWRAIAARYYQNRSVVRVEWLMDSIAQMRRLHEVLYTPKVLTSGANPNRYNLRANTSSTENLVFTSLCSPIVNKSNHIEIDDIDDDEVIAEEILMDAEEFSTPQPLAASEESDEDEGEGEGEESLIPGVRRGKDGDIQPTMCNPNFVKQFFEKSRLHLLGCWKDRINNIQGLVELEQGPVLKIDALPSIWNPMRILHVDFDAFFTSVAINSHENIDPSRPIAVAHGSDTQSTSELASCNYVARSYGVEKGMYLRDAFVLCQDLQVIPYNIELVKQANDELLQTLLRITPRVMPVSCDEAYVQLIGQQGMYSKNIALWIRETIYARTNCTVSVGIGDNMYLAKMATNYIKKNMGMIESFSLPDTESTDMRFRMDMVKSFLSPFPISTIHGVGPSTERSLIATGIRTIGDLQVIAPSELSSVVKGARGNQLREFAHGIDNRQYQNMKQQETISANLTWGIRVRNDEEIRWLCDEVLQQLYTRFDTQTYLPRFISLRLYIRAEHAPRLPVKFGGRGECFEIHGREILTAEVFQPVEILRKCYSIWEKALKPICKISDVRGINISLQRLERTKLSKAPSLKTFIENAKLTPRAEKLPSTTSGLLSRITSEHQEALKTLSHKKLTSQSKLDTNLSKATPVISNLYAIAAQMNKSKSITMGRSNPTISTLRDPEKTAEAPNHDYCELSDSSIDIIETPSNGFNNRPSARLSIIDQIRSFALPNRISSDTVGNKSSEQLHDAAAETLSDSINIVQPEDTTKVSQITNLSLKAPIKRTSPSLQRKGIPTGGADIRAWSVSRDYKFGPANTEKTTRQIKRTSRTSISSTTSKLYGYSFNGEYQILTISSSDNNEDTESESESESKSESKSESESESESASESESTYENRFEQIEFSS